MSIMISMKGDADLTQVASALTAPRRLARRLDRRYQQPGKETDDADDHEDFDQRQSPRTPGPRCGMDEHDRLPSRIEDSLNQGRRRP